MHTILRINANWLIDFVIQCGSIWSISTQPRRGQYDFFSDNIKGYVLYIFFFIINFELYPWKFRIFHLLK